MKKFLTPSCVVALIGALVLVSVSQVSAQQYTITNGSTTQEVVPITDARSAVAYYDWGAPGIGNPDFGTENNVGFFWLYEESDTGEISLGMIFNSTDAGDSDGGSADMTITGVASTGFVALTDDPNELTSVNGGVWTWSPAFTDGGVIGGLEGFWEITITLNSFDGIDTWYFLNGPWPDSPSRTQLDMSKDLVIFASLETLALDIKPQSCPNPLNTKSQGVLPVAILGTANFDVTNIDAASIRLEGVAPVRSTFEDVATPVLDPQNGCDCNELGGDAIDDLTLKFNTQEIVDAIGDVEDREEVEVTITGVLQDGTPFEGKDCIVILAKGGKGKVEKPDQCYAGVPKTGQTESYYPGDDGDLEKGICWPNPRFTINGGTVTDNLTGLMWLRDANCMRSEYPEIDSDNVLGDGHVNWYHALDFVAGINGGTYSNCGAGYNDWRVPNVRELLSLIDYRFNNPAIPNAVGTDQWTEGNPFSVEAGWYRYWSSTTWSNNSDEAWWVSYSSGFSERAAKDNVGDSYRVWPVRGGN